MGKKTRSIGPESFFTYYEQLYGSRWKELYSALIHQNQYGCLNGNHGTRYYLDIASIIVAWSLDVLPGQQVLDLCAAPGGKALVLMRNIFPQWFSLEELTGLEQLIQDTTNLFEGNSTLYSKTSIEKLDLAKSMECGTLRINEKSPPRKERLKQNIHQHQNPNMNIVITGYDGSKYGLHMKNQFDRVLADVPCSSEQHLIHNPKYLKEWSPARTKHLSIQAGAIAISGFDCLKPKGRMVYSTCALSPKENEVVMKKLLSKRKNGHIVELSKIPEGFEQKDPGYLILPDRCKGLGPMYFCVIEKEGIY
jgi:16S rRNA C967 or C1407 C5-methylase (RsmB/RsmF family)